MMMMIPDLVSPSLSQLADSTLNRGKGCYRFCSVRCRIQEQSLPSTE
jgi:hypothetical protein